MVKKQAMKSLAKNEGDILNRLSAGLSEQEIRRVLAGALNSLDHAGVHRLLKRVGHETATALRRVLHADSSKRPRSEEHTSELQSHSDLVCRLLLEKKNR